MSLPESTSHTGWPDELTDVDGHEYIRVRDGTPGENEFTGTVCQYVRVNEESELGYDSDAMYVPTLDSTEDAVRMAGGAFTTPEQCVQLGIPPVELP